MTNVYNANSGQKKFRKYETISRSYVKYQVFQWIKLNKSKSGDGVVQSSYHCASGHGFYPSSGHFRVTQIENQSYLR